MDDLLRDIIYPALDDFSDVYDVTIEKTPDTVLWGEGTALSSFDFVNLILSIERVLKERRGAAVVLADASAFSSERSPFQTLATLAAYIEEKLGDD